MGHPTHRPPCEETPGRDLDPGRVDLVAGTLTTRPPHLPTRPTHLLHLQNPYFYFFAIGPKMSKNKTKFKKQRYEFSTIKLVKNSKQTFSTNLFKQVFLSKLALFLVFPLVKTQLSVHLKMFLVVGIHLTIA